MPEFTNAHFFSHFTPVLRRALLRASWQESTLSQLLQPLGELNPAHCAKGLALQDTLAINTHPYWLAAYAVECRADMNTVHLIGSEHLALTAEENTALLSSLNEHFAQDGYTLHGNYPGRWYIAADKPFGFSALAPWYVASEDLHQFMPTGDKGDVWRRLQSECQMLLHAHPVNEARRAKGLPCVSNVWFFGAAEPMGETFSREQVLVTQTPWLRLQATQSGVDCVGFNAFESVLKSKQPFVFYDDSLLHTNNTLDTHATIAAQLEIALYAMKKKWLSELVLFSQKSLCQLTRPALKAWRAKHKSLEAIEVLHA